MKNLFMLFAAIGLSVMVSCKNDTLTYAEQLAVDTEKIEAYLTSHNLTAQKTSTGLYYIITDEGNADNIKPAFNSTVTVRYKGYFLDDTVFDETEGTSLAQFNVSGVVSGFGQGLQLLNKKGKGTFLLPSGLAYGAYGSGSIEPNTPIIFDIELVDFF